MALFRDGLNFSPSVTESLVAQACEPTLPEPPYAVHLELAEHILRKKANTPREAAIAILRHVNGRNPHVALLALHLLDSLVQRCGYPFHLQIATKEFLNELVRRFPERPPPYPGPVMTRILNLIHVWKQGICAESRWKEDLGNIRDMHRLLTFKGYRFRDEAPDAAMQQASGSNLKSAEELENEDREAQSAKLQELIRRGTPRDLQAAQEIMKSLAGANPDAKPDYRTEALMELNKLEQKVILLNEILDNVDVERGEKFASGDVYDQVASLLVDARPKIQKWIGDAESEDTESLDTFLQINDQINLVLERLEAFKKGDYAAAKNPIPSQLAGASSAAKQNLIDFDLDEPSASNPPPASNGTSGIDDLASLFSSQPAPTPQQTTTATNPMHAFSSPAFSQPPSRPTTNSMSLFGTVPKYGRPMSNPASPSPMQTFGGGPGIAGSIALPGTPTPMGGNAQAVSPAPVPNRVSSMASQQPAQPAQSNAQAGKDPFADLAGLF